jgi:hypothetical protein
MMKTRKLVQEFQVAVEYFQLGYNSPWHVMRTILSCCEPHFVMIHELDKNDSSLFGVKEEPGTYEDEISVIEVHQPAPQLESTGNGIQE